MWLLDSTCFCWAFTPAVCDLSAKAGGTGTRLIALRTAAGGPAAGQPENCGSQAGQRP